MHPLKLTVATLACVLLLASSSTVQAGSVTLAWDPPVSGDARGYLLGYGTQSGVYTQVVNVGAATTHTIGGLADGRTYFFVVVSYDAAGRISLPTPELRGSMCASAPTAPSGMTATIGGTLVNLSWQAAAGGAIGYLLEAGSAPGQRDLATLNVESTSFSAHAPPGRYYLRVIALNDCGSSAASNEVVATVGGTTEVLPGAPRSLTRTVSGSMVALSWAPPSTGGAPLRYIIEGLSGGAVIGSIDTGSPATTISHPAVPRGTYVLRVRAANGAGVGPPSSTVTVVVP